MAKIIAFDEEARRALERGVARVEPRMFPYTSPNACAGECAVALGLRGPAFAVGGGAHGGVEALVIAGDLVRAGDADAMLVVAVDDGAAAGRPGARGAVGAWVCAAEPSRAHARLGEGTLTLPRPVPELLGPCHTALVPLAEGRPSSLADPAGFANLPLFWL